MHVSFPHAPFHFFSPAPSHYYTPSFSSHLSLLLTFRSISYTCTTLYIPSLLNFPLYLLSPSRPYTSYNLLIPPSLALGGMGVWYGVGGTVWGVVWVVRYGMGGMVRTVHGGDECDR